MKVLAGLAAAAAASMSMEAATPDTPNAGQIAPARDGDIAIQEELCAARNAGTAAAYDLFIARHPRHPLAAIARKERAALVAGLKRGD